ncbi:UNVERIFIED_CONTAM: hypothetical protein ABIE34_003524, partial [Jeotgalibacillus campisalis]
AHVKPVTRPSQPPTQRTAPTHTTAVEHSTQTQGN